MKITTKSRYGLRAMIQLSIDSIDKTRTTLVSIAQKQSLSERYLEQIFAILKKGGLVLSTRGVNGGYTLAREPSSITVEDVLRVLEDPVEIVSCLKEDSCPKEDECLTRAVWKKIFDCMMVCAGEISLQDILDMAVEVRNSDDEENDIFGPCSNNENKR